MLAGVQSKRNKSGFWIALRGGFAAAHNLLGCLTVVLMRTNNDKWLPHADPPNP
jgi:hypothetical protein